MRQGEKLQTEGKYERALEVYRRLIRSSPEDTDLHRQYQNCLDMLDRGHVARSQYRRRLRADSTSAHNWYLLGRVLEDPEEARLHFEQAIRRDSTFAWAHYGLGVQWAQEEAYEEAAAALRTALRLELPEADAVFWAGWSFEKLGWNRQAVAAYRRYLKGAPADEKLAIHNKIKVLQGDFSSVAGYVVIAFVPAMGWFWYLRRKGTIGSVSWQNSLMLVIAGAVFSAFLLTDWLYEGLHNVSGSHALYRHPLLNRVVRHLLVVGPVEEFSKWVFVMLLAYWTRFVRDPLDGMICAGCVALGFAWAENVLYMFHEGWAICIPRNIIPVHLMCSGLWGYGVGLARVTKNRKKAWLGMGLSLMAGASFHGLYNASLEFRAWQEASELTLYAGLAMPVVVWVLVRAYRRHLMLARLWTPFCRRSQALKRQVASVLDPAIVNRTWGLRQGTKKARRHWSASVNVVAQNALARLAKSLDYETSEQVDVLLTKSETTSREILAQLSKVRAMDEMIVSECRQFERLLAGEGGDSLTAKWKTRRLRKRTERQLQVESMPHGPVGLLQR